MAKAHLPLMLRGSFLGTSINLLRGRMAALRGAGFGRSASPRLTFASLTLAYAETFVLAPAASLNFGCAHLSLRRNSVSQ
ncbi:MAG: hypothetical protein ACK4Q4_03315 [Rhodocyclaceae bacterium]